MIKYACLSCFMALLTACAPVPQSSKVTVSSPSDELSSQLGAKSIFMGGEGVQLSANNNHSPTTSHPDTKRPAPTEPSSDFHGLTYWIEREGPTGPQRVTASTMFRAGDHIRFHVQANHPGYLYVLNQGTSGKTTLLFPSRNNEDEFIQAGQTYAIPTHRSILFDSQSGQEIVWLFVSQRPISETVSGPNTIIGGERSVAVNAGYRPDRNSCGSKDLLVNSPDLLNQDCGISGGKDMMTQDDPLSPSPAGYVVGKSERLDQGKVLSLRLVLNHQ